MENFLCDHVIKNCITVKSRAGCGKAGKPKWYNQ